MFIVGSQVVARRVEVARPSCRSRAQDGRDTGTFSFSFCGRTAEERGTDTSAFRGNGETRCLVSRLSVDLSVDPSVDLSEDSCIKQQTKREQTETKVRTESQE